MVSADQEFDPTLWPLKGPEMLDRKRLRTLQRRSDGPGLRFLAIHVAALLATGFLVHVTRGSLLIVPATIIHGTVIVLLFGTLHECTHGTAFKTRWLNQAVAWFAAILTLRPALYFKYRHATHHTYTQHPELDPDIVPMPRSFGSYVKLILGFSFWPKLVGTLYRGVFGRFNADERSFIPRVELRRVSREARILCSIYALVLVGSVALATWTTLIYWFLPRLLGEPVLRAIRMAEHTGAEESPDLLRNTRTTLCNPILRMLYWNMPFHAEHHLATSVPFHALPALHAEVGSRLECVGSNYLAVHAEILRQIRRKRRSDPASVNA
jgi:fatty acid desaturase